MYAASAELSATDIYFLLYQETMIDPMLKTQPKVLFQSMDLVAQYASVKPSSLTPSTYS